MEEKKRFYLRGFTSLTILLLFLSLVVSSLVAFVAPAGRDAHWVSWKFLGLLKEQWEALHNITGLVFIGLSIVHIILNIRPILNYIAVRAKKALSHPLELALAVILTAVLTTGALTAFPPFNSFLDWQTSLKEGWVAEKQKAPVAHTELMKFAEFNAAFGFDTATTYKALEARGFKLDTNKTIQFIAAENGVSPAEIYKIASEADGGQSGNSGSRPTGTVLTEGSGYGRKTVQSFSKEIGQDVSVSLKRLQKNGTPGAAGDSLRNLSERYGLTPLEIAEIIKE